jgi:hypothetical protein
MATPTYSQLKEPSDNLKELIRSQNEDGTENAVLSGYEPFEVLVSKAVFNANENGGGGVGGGVPNNGSVTNIKVAAGAAIDQSKIANLTSDLAAKASATDLSTHIANASNPHSVTKAQIGLGNADNTSDANKPVSTATQTALNLKVNATGGTLTDGTLAGTTTASTINAASVGVGVALISTAQASDDTYAGFALTGRNAGATIAQWEAVYLSSSSTWLLADANGSGTYPARGLAVAAYSNTDAATIIVQGSVRNDAWNWTPGGDIYLSTTAGGLTQTAPNTAGDKVQPVGFAITADIAYFHFNQAYGEVSA